MTPPVADLAPVTAPPARGYERLPDERLAALAAHDSQAFAELHARHDAALLRFARRMLRDGHDAADAVQDTWTRALAALQDAPPRTSVRGWLFGIARNACLDRHRDGKRCAPAELRESMLGAGSSPDDVLELRERAKEALQDLSRLSGRQRDALLLREVAGLEGDAFADALGTDTRRASWLLTDARRSLGDFRAGRDLSCQVARDQLERSRIRSRRLRAHLEDCRDCGTFAHRRVVSRVPLHGFGVLAALPTPLRNLLLGFLPAEGAAVVAAVAISLAPAAPVAVPDRTPERAAASAARQATPLTVAGPRPAPTVSPREEPRQATPRRRARAVQPIVRIPVPRPAPAIAAAPAAATEPARSSEPVARSAEPVRAVVTQAVKVARALEPVRKVQAATSALVADVARTVDASSSAALAGP